MKQLSKTDQLRVIKYKMHTNFKKNFFSPNQRIIFTTEY